MEVLEEKYYSENQRFEFENFLEEHEEQLPEGLDPLFLGYVRVIEHPMKNIRKLPKAITNLPMSALLHQPWSVQRNLYLLIVLLASPTLFLMLFASYIYDKLAIGITLMILIIAGIGVSSIYMKAIYNLISNLVDSKKAPWLSDDIKKPFNDLYQSSWDRNSFMIAFIIPLIPEIKLFIILISSSKLPVGLFVLWLFLIVIGHFGITQMCYLAISVYKLIWNNTKIYDLLLSKIISRVKGYTEGHESILTKKNYEVVKVLSDTPGLSIRSLGDIPIYGLGAALFIINGLLLLILVPYITNGVLADTLIRISKNSRDPTGMTYILLLGIAISAIAAFGAVMMPLIRISRAMARFKNKALIELDPYIFEEITSVALQRDREITNETLTLYMIRNYIYSMKVSPVPPFRLIYVVLISIVYASRVVPYVVLFLTKLGISGF